MGEAGQIIQWIVQLGPMVLEWLKAIIDEIKGGKKPASLVGGLPWLASALGVCQGILALVEKLHIIFRGPVVDEAVVVLKAVIAALTELQALSTAA